MPERTPYEIYSDAMIEIVKLASLKNKVICDVYKAATDEVVEAVRVGRMAPDEANLRIAEAYERYSNGLNHVHKEKSDKESKARLAYERTLYTH